MITRTRCALLGTTPDHAARRQAPFNHFIWRHQLIGAAKLRLTPLNVRLETNLVRVLSLPHIIKTLGPYWPASQYACLDLVGIYYEPNLKNAAALSALMKMSHGVHDAQPFHSLQLAALGRKTVGRPEPQLGDELNLALLRLCFGGREAPNAPQWKQSPHAGALHELFADIRSALTAGPINATAHADAIERLALLTKAVRIWNRALERIT